MKKRALRRFHRERIINKNIKRVIYSRSSWDLGFREWRYRTRPPTDSSVTFCEFNHNIDREWSIGLMTGKVDRRYFKQCICETCFPHRYGLPDLLERRANANQKEQITEYKLYGVEDYE